MCIVDGSVGASDPDVVLWVDTVEAQSAWPIRIAPVVGAFAGARCVAARKVGFDLAVITIDFVSGGPPIRGTHNVGLYRAGHRQDVKAG